MSEQAGRAIEAEEARDGLVISAVSVWEVAVKVAQRPAHAPVPARAHHLARGSQAAGGLDGGAATELQWPHLWLQEGVLCGPSVCAS